MAAAAGKPMLSDEEYDELKAQLRNKNSRVVQQASLTCAQHSRDFHRRSNKCAWAIVSLSSVLQCAFLCEICICTIMAAFSLSEVVWMDVLCVICKCPASIWCLWTIIASLQHTR